MIHRTILKQTQFIKKNDIETSDQSNQYLNINSSDFDRPCFR